MHLSLILYVGAALLMVAYTIAARQSPKLPKIQTGFFILFCLLKIAAHTPLQEYIGKPILDALALVALCFGLIRAAFSFVLDHIIGRKRAITIPAITRDFLLFGIYLLIIIFVLREKLDIDVTSLVATSAILTAVVGLAMQDTLGNLFAGLALNIEKPYKLGDWVTFDKYKGQVHGINWRSTILLTPEHEMIVVPNNVISKSHIVNHSDPSTLLISTFSVGIDYNVPPNRVTEVILSVVKQHPRVLADKPIEVRLISFDAYSIQYQARYWVDIFQGRSDTTRSDIMKQLWYRLRRENISIPYPIHVAYKGDEPTKEESHMRAKKFLQKIDLFQALSPLDRETLMQSITPLEFAAGESVFQAGDAGESMYILTEGECEITIKNSAGREKEMALLTPGDFFGEVSLMTGEPRKANVTAKSDLLLYEIDKKTILKLLEVTPKLMEIFSEHLAKRAAERASVLSQEEIANDPEGANPSATHFLHRIKTFFRV